MTTTVAHTILAQLGGNKFLAMTGARDLVRDDNSLQMRLPRFPGLRINTLRITLTAMDDYQIEGLNIRGISVKPVAFKDGVPAENLPLAVERMTGLRVSL